MGIWRTPFVMPSDHRRLTHDDFIMLILRIFHEQHGKSPVKIVSGWVTQKMQRPVGMVYYPLSLDVPKEVTQFPCKIPVDRYDPLTGEKTGKQEIAIVRYYGDDRDMIAHALASLPFDCEDINVEFDDWGGPSLHALAQPRDIAFFDAYDTDNEMHEITMQVCEFSGGGMPIGDDYLYHDPLMLLLEEYYGPNMRVAFSYS